MKFSYKKLSLILVSLGTIVVLATTFISDDNHQSMAQALPPSVQTLVAKAQPLSLSNELPGRVEAFRIAEVRARVEGIILSRDFEEGTLVKEGQTLFQIDPTFLQYTLSKAQAELARNKANLEELETKINRYKALIKNRAISQQEFDSMLSSFKNMQAAYEASIAEVNIAKLNLDYATVKAPITGRIGRSFVTEGALVGHSESTPLAVIQQIDPIYVDFKQPANSVLELREKLTNSNGRFIKEKLEEIPITVELDGSSQIYRGRLLFSDITVERNTGQVLLRGILDNPDAILLPGMFARVNIEQSIDNQAILIPQRAVKIRTDGKAEVLVVNTNSVIESRTINTGKMYGSNWYITAGLNNGDIVVVNGEVQAGQQVTITDYVNQTPQNMVNNFHTKMTKE